MTDGAVGLWERNKNRPTHGKAEHLDEVLGADGAVLAAFGYQATRQFATQDAVARELAKLREHLDDNEHKIRLLMELIDALELRLEAIRPEGPSDQSTRRSRARHQASCGGV